MCGIVGAVAERNIVPVLVEGLKRLEYRGYDSAGVAIYDGESWELTTRDYLPAVEHRIDSENTVKFPRTSSR